MRKSKKATLNRRSWMRSAAALATGTAALAVGGDRLDAEPKPASAPGETTIIVSDTHAIVETAAGKVQGFTRNGILTFRGIPYAASPEGKARFMPPTKPKPWADVRTALWYGKTCPQVARAGWGNDVDAFLSQWDDGQPGEDCLRVNIWSPGLDKKKRPAMVWIHGGGFLTGSGQEQPAYYGENLSRRGDVVVVSLNHRLGALGFLNLAAYGPQYAESANVGMLDLVAALEWVRDNIANFGGDPGNVTIFGQSGGAGKVGTLLTMPMAKGLFGKAILQSGSLLTANKPEETARLAEVLLAELGLGAQVAKLHELPVNQLIAAAAAASRKISGAVRIGGVGASVPRMLLGPTADGRILPNVPFTPAAPECSRDVAMLIGTTLHEFNPAASNPKAEAMTEEALSKELADTYGDRAGKILAAARQLYPNAKPVAIQAILGAYMFRNGAITQAERKTAQAGAPAWMYQFAWETPVMNGRPRAFHCSEIPFVFYNTDVSAFVTGGGPVPRALAEKVSDAWINFARKGDPNHAGLPKWPKFNSETRPLMIFNNKSEVKEDPDRVLRALLRPA